MNLNQYDPSGKRCQLTICPGEIRLDPRTLRRPDTSESPSTTTRRVELPVRAVIFVGGLFPGDSAVEPVVSIVSNGCVDRIVASSDCMFVCGTTSNVYVMSPLVGGGALGSPRLI
jgi:hypothetical protein